MSLLLYNPNLPLWRKFSCEPAPREMRHYGHVSIQISANEFDDDVAIGAGRCRLRGSSSSRTIGSTSSCLFFFIASRNMSVALCYRELFLKCATKAIGRFPFGSTQNDRDCWPNMRRQIDHNSIAVFESQSERNQGQCSSGRWILGHSAIFWAVDNPPGEIAW